MNRLWLSIIRLARVATDRFSWWLVVSCAFFVVVLGTLGFRDENPEQPVLTSIYRAIQLFVMETSNMEGRVNIKLEIARWLGVAVLFGTLLKGLLTAFEDRVEALIIRSLSDHIIVCGAGERGLNLAYDLTDHADFVVLIDMHDHWQTDDKQQGHRGLFYLKGNAGEQATLKAAATSRARSMFVIDSSDDVNLDIVTEALDLASESDRSLPLVCYVHLENQDLFHHLTGFIPTQSQVEVRPFNLNFNSMRAFIQNTSIDIPVLSSKEGKFVLAGNSSILDQCLSQFMRSCLRPDETKTAITVIGKDATQRINRFTERYPQSDKLLLLESIDSEHPSTALLSLAQRVTDLSAVAIIIASDSDSESLEQYLSCQQLGLFGAHQFAIYQSDTRGIARLLSNQVPEFFGLFDEACNAKTIIQEELDALAKEIHGDYLSQRVSEGAALGSSPGLHEWADLSEEYRSMNRRQADHIYAKCRFIGTRVVPLNQETGKPYRFTDDDVEILARIEHRRWMAERFLDGWQYGATRNDQQKLHPNLVPWEELDESTREYDRKPVMQIPSLLKSVGLHVVSCE
jgi:hypothetical protein